MPIEVLEKQLKEVVGECNIALDGIKSQISTLTEEKMLCKKDIELKRSAIKR